VEEKKKIDKKLGNKIKKFVEKNRNTTAMDVYRN